MMQSRRIQYFAASSVAIVFSIARLCAQAPATSQPPENKGAPIYRVTVVQRALEAVNFQSHSGPTRIDFKGTLLLPKAEGEAKVEVKNGYTEIDANFKHLDPPTQFGAEFLTYVLWAITPDGHAINLGEVIADTSNKASMRVTSPYSTFGLIITAEPYFSVPYPSDVVVMESAVRPDTIGSVQQVEAKYELLPRGQYTLNVRAQELASANMKNAPNVSMAEYEALLELYQARNAVQIAKADGAADAAADTFNKAQDSLNQAESLYTRKDFSGAVTAAKQAVQAASDARVIAMKKKASTAQPQQ
ncbi:MAG: DUF4398 domain-containing protein [Acidobacteriaceae bacterium]|nr:DUF4398 domain-containing protein [Acidobacteriaceae bacterium]MBV9780291.1 DUF4398 domain-containing protein [Acidobacteriaceae bacterium]